MSRPIKTKIIRLGKGVFHYCGPVAGAVVGELNKPERQRVAVKFVFLWVLGGTTVTASVKDPDFQEAVLAPAVMAAGGAAWEVMSRKAQGEPKPLVPPDLPPEQIKP